MSSLGTLLSSSILIFRSVALGTAALHFACSIPRDCSAGTAWDLLPAAVPQRKRPSRVAAASPAWFMCAGFLVARDYAALTSTIGLALDIVGVLLLLFATSQRLIEATLTVKAVDDGWITISGYDEQAPSDVETKHCPLPLIVLVRRALDSGWIRFANCGPVACDIRANRCETEPAGGSVGAVKDARWSDAVSLTCFVRHLL